MSSPSRIAAPHAGTTASPWLETPPRQFAALDRDLDVDVAVIGAGITGTTTAWLMLESGLTVALLDRHVPGTADTGHTTAHLTCVTDSRLHELVHHFGEDGARTLWQAGDVAIGQIEAIVRATGADCGFRRVPGYLHARHHRDEVAQREIYSLREDAELAARLGFDARFIEHVPHVGGPGMRIGGQATFDPGRYLDHLLGDLAKRGAHVHGDTSVDSIEAPAADQRRELRAGAHRIRCRFVMIATHNPLAGSVGTLRATLFQTKLALYTSYVVGALAAPTLPDALFWDTGDPYRYLRIEPRGDQQLVILGGADAKTGQGDDSQAFVELEHRLAQLVPGADVTHRWLGQVIETDDGLPFIGEHAPGEFIATGFSGNGFTFGTLAAVMARDAVLGHGNPWRELLRVDRKPFHGGLKDYVLENLDYPVYLVKSRLRRAEADALDEVPPGEGRVVALDAGKCAVYRADDGTLSVCSAVCTHLKCLVRWNNADRSWDCPCHGSRFAPDGEVLGGPAEQPLQRIEVRTG